MPTPPANALAFLKADLGYFNTKIPDDLTSYLQGLIITAGISLQKRGILLEAGNAADDQFLASYAAWLYRNKTGAAMPVSLAQEIRDRQVGNATALPKEVHQ